MNALNFRTFSLLLLCSLAYIGINPHWYGDALWYAMDVKEGKLWQDAFHLGWIPLASLLLWALRALHLNLDPIYILQFLSGVGMFVSLFGTHLLSQRLGFTTVQSRAAAAIVGLSHFAVAYGGSGASYSPAVGFFILSIATLARPEGFSLRDGVWAGIWMMVALLSWGVSILTMPAFFVASVLYTPKSRSGKLGWWILPSLVACGSFALLLGLVYWTLFEGRATTEFMSWLLAAKGHGAGFSLSVVSIARAVLGLISSFVYLSTLGTSVKGILSGEVRGGALLEMVPFIAIAVGVVAALLYFGVRSLRDSSSSRKLLILAGATIIPVGGFALFWHGSDVERWCFCLPFFALLLVCGASQQLAHRVLLLPLCLGVWNTTQLIVPDLLTRGGIDMALGREALNHIPEGSLLVVTGQYLGSKGGNTTVYFYNLGFHSISFDVLMRGAEGWDSRLSAAIDTALDNGKEVAVLSDLRGEPTPQGIGLSPKEFPVPSPKQTTEFFSRWGEKSRWSVMDYTFVVLEKP